MLLEMEVALTMDLLVLIEYILFVSVMSLIVMFCNHLLMVKMS